MIAKTDFSCDKYHPILKRFKIRTNWPWIDKRICTTLLYQGRKFSFSLLECNALIAIPHTSDSKAGHYIRGGVQKKQKITAPSNELRNIPYFSFSESSNLLVIPWASRVLVSPSKTVTKSWGFWCSFLPWEFSSSHLLLTFLRMMTLAHHSPTCWMHTGHNFETFWQFKFN